MDKTYREIWDGLTEAQRRVISDTPGTIRGSDSEITALKHMGLILYNGMVFAVTELGKQVYQAGQSITQTAGIVTTGDVLSQLADLRAQLAASQAREQALEAALREITNRAPESKPIEDSDYAWDDLNEGREMCIASSHYTYGDELAWWYAADIARKALKDDSGKEDSVR